MNAAVPRRGFTLVELLVATAITVLVAAVLLTIVSGTLRVWSRAQAGFGVDTQAKLVLDLLERDLQAAVFRADGRAWLAVDVINSPAALGNHGWLVGERMKPAGAASQRLVPVAPTGAEPDIAGVRFGLSGAWLRFVTTNVESKDSSNPGGSLPTAVAYQICRRPLTGDVEAANPSPVRYALFRSAVRNRDAFASGLDVQAAAYASALHAPADSRKPRSLANPGKVDVLATDVVDLAVWFHRRDAGGELVRIFPATATDLAQVVRWADETPQAADVMLRVLTGEGAQLLAAMERGGAGLVRPAEFANDDDWWWAIAVAHSRVYVRRIELRGGGR